MMIFPANGMGALCIPPSQAGWGDAQVELNIKTI